MNGKKRVIEQVITEAGPVPDRIGVSVKVRPGLAESEDILDAASSPSLSIAPGYYGALPTVRVRLAHSIDSAVRRDENQCAVAQSAPAVRYGVETEKHCVYNQTRQCFLGADVDAADFSSTGAESRLPTLAPHSGTGLWLLPFKGISPTVVRVPVDLVYLDRHCRAIDTVESFPLSRVSASCPPVASVLVLPADTLRATETQPGDQLILCPPDEMKRHLLRLAGASVDTELELAGASGRSGPVRNGAFRLLQWEDRSRLHNPTETVLAVDPAPELLPPEPPSLVPESQETVAIELAVSEPAPRNIKPSKTWLQRLLFLDAPEARKAPRESLPSLVAYFFTGGAPEPHSVRDISLSGMYVFTKERWYAGTMVRITLTDRLEPTVERSITLNMAVVRSGNDGVGLKFLLQSGRNRGQEPSGGMNKIQVGQFLHRLRRQKECR